MLENNNFAARFIYLKLRREHKEGYTKVGESQVGAGLQTVKVMCSLEGGCTYFKGVLT